MSEEKLVNMLTTFISFELKDKLIKNQNVESSEVIVEQKIKGNLPTNSDIINLANKLYWLDKHYGGIKGSTHIIYVNGNKLKSHPKLSPEQAEKYRGQEHD